MERGVGFERDQNDDGFECFARQDTPHDAFGIVGRNTGLQFGAIDVVEYGVIDEDDATRIEFYVGVVDLRIWLDECDRDGTENITRVCVRQFEGVVETSSGTSGWSVGATCCETATEGLSENATAAFGAAQKNPRCGKTAKITLFSMEVPFGLRLET